MTMATATENRMVQSHQFNVAADFISENRATNGQMQYVSVFYYPNLKRLVVNHLGVCIKTAISLLEVAIDQLTGQGYQITPDLPRPNDENQSSYVAIFYHPAGKHLSVHHGNLQIEGAIDLLRLGINQITE